MSKQKKRNPQRVPKSGTRASKNVRRDREIIDTSRREERSDLEQRGRCTGPDNDWRWYAQNETLLKSYASFPFGVALGVAPQTGIPNVDAGSVPGVMSLNFTPTIGIATDPNSPINVASRNIYSYVRHANSGHANYDAPDLMLYLIAMDSVNMYHSFLRRLLGVQMLYMQQNRYTPQVLTTAMGVDFNDLQHHLVDLRGYLNQFAVKMGSMAVPNSMSYFARHQWMCENVYVDNATTAKAQWYFYTPDSFYVFSRNTETQVGQLNLTRSISNQYRDAGTLMRFTDLVDLGNSLLDPILAEEDFNIMAGDILKAFGDGGIIKMYATPDNYVVLPVYSAEVLSQIENCICGNGIIAGASITQKTGIDEGYLISHPTITYLTPSVGTVTTPITYALSTSSDQFTKILTPIFSGNKILNFHHADPTPADVMVATRLMPAFDMSGFESEYPIVHLNGYDQFAVPMKACGSEVVNAAIIWNYTGTKRTITATRIGYFENSGSYGQFLYDSVTEEFRRIELLSAFDWHPAVIPMYTQWNRTDGAITFMSRPEGIVMDIDNYTYLTGDNLLNLHTTALLSMFTVPLMGAASMSGI